MRGGKVVHSPDDRLVGRQAALLARAPASYSRCPSILEHTQLDTVLTPAIQRIQRLLTVSRATHDAPLFSEVIVTIL